MCILLSINWIELLIGGIFGAILGAIAGYYLVEFSDIRRLKKERQELEKLTGRFIAKRKSNSEPKYNLYPVAIIQVNLSKGLSLSFLGDSIKGTNYSGTIEMQSQIFGKGIYSHPPEYSPKYHTTFYSYGIINLNALKYHLRGPNLSRRNKRSV
jgi:hypothetical protein